MTKLVLVGCVLFFNRTISAEFVGKIAVFRETGRQKSLDSYLIRVRVVSRVEPDFKTYFINASCGRNWIKSCMSQNVDQANMNEKKLKSLMLPLSSSEEQLNHYRLKSVGSILAEANHIYNERALHAVFKLPHECGGFYQYRPMADQMTIKIVRCIEKKMQSADRLNKELDYQLLKVEKNKQSMLASVFSGVL